MHKETFTRPLLPLLFIAGSLLLSACSTMSADPKADWTAKDYYDEAKSSLDNGEFQTAINNLETLEAQFPFDPYAKQAQLDVAYAYYKFDEPESAISAANRFMRLHPRDPHIDYAYYLKGLVNFNRGSGFLDSWVPRDHARHDASVILQAYNDFSTLVRLYPDSDYAGDAHQRMVFLRNKLAQKEIDIAEFYIERETWLSAINRAKNVIEQYQDSIWSHRALEIMVEGYKNLGIPDLATDAQRVLSMNQVDSEQKIASPENQLGEPPAVARNLN
ncbi:MAG: outer membrane protein assembly factor BamD [Gammaproteobacteria bacterium]|jgi:outer membrane protein assembly factor BamD|nr:outer membrane protein assembly factor BamD [Gammaproteobacteria bacterium]